MPNEIYPCLWFDGNAQEAAKFYCNLFPETKIIDDGPMVTLMLLSGRKVMLLNGGQQFKLNESFSFVVQCETQEEIDKYWNALTANGKESMCGWCADQFGVWWQIIPAVLPQLMRDAERSQPVIAAFMKMKKFDIETLLKA